MGPNDQPVRIGVDTPGSQALRRGRASLPGCSYVLTFCTLDRMPILTGPGVPERIVATVTAFGVREDVDVQAYVIMPDHVHAIVKIRGEPQLADVVRQLKSILAREVNRQLQRHGPVWQAGYHDRLIRRADEYEEHRWYIWQNPVRAGLVERAEDYPWCEVNDG